MVLNTIINSEIKKNLTKQTQSHLQAFSEIFIDCLSLTTELSRVHSSKQDPKL